jgi:PAS domain S-box-containing protein
MSKLKRALQGLVLLVFILALAFLVFVVNQVGLPEEFFFSGYGILSSTVIVGVGTLFAILALLAFEVILRREQKAIAQAEQAFRDVNIFKQALEDVSDHISVSDVEGRVLYANRSVEKTTGFAMEEMMGKKVGSKELWGGLMGKEFYDDLWRTIKIEKRVYQGQLKNKDKDGHEYEVYLVITPILDERKVIKFFVSVERNITKEKQIDRAKSEFVSLASHQLRTPLSTVSWYAEMLLAGDAGVLNDEQKNYVEEIYQGNRRMVELVNALLNVSRLELGSFIVEPEPTHLIPIAESVLAEVKPLSEKKQVTITQKFAPDLPVFNVDPKLLRIIFQNLLSNAVKYTPEKGTITLEVVLDEKKENVSIKVADSGYGIPREQQEKIFTKLFRADNVKDLDAEGTGLGLYIVKSIIDQFKGKVWFESVLNKGTTFTVMVPLEGMKKKEGRTKLSESIY